MKQASSTLLRDVSEQIDARIRGFRALALVNLDGNISEYVSVVSNVNEETFSEYVTLLRIADRTSADARTGRLLEASWVSDQSTVLSRRVSAGTFLIFIGEPAISTGLARYTLRQTAGQLQPLLETA